MACDTTVDLYQRLVAGRGGKFCQCRRQARAHAKPVRYNVIDAARAERRQPADGYRNASRAVTVIVTGDDDRLVIANRIDDELRRRRDAMQAGRWQQMTEFEFEFVDTNAARRVDTEIGRAHV